MQVWIPPKTDWKIAYDEQGNYTGDYFEPHDFNRIKNNITFLYGLAEKVYNVHPVYEDVGEDAYYGSPVEMFASRWGAIQNNLENINAATVERDIGTRKIFYSNTAGRLLEELIRIEQATLDIYDSLMAIERNKTRLAFRLGERRKIKC